MKKLLLFFSLIFVVNVSLANNDNGYKTIKETESNRFVNTVEMRFLDKITAKSFTKKIKIGKLVRFEKLIIVPLKCWKSYPEEPTENKLLVKVYENNKKNNENKLIFYGWIFSSTPSVSGLEHPMYDITLVDCNNYSYDN